MKNAMEKIYNTIPKRNNAMATLETDAGPLSLTLVATSRGARMFHRKDWFLSGEKVPASVLVKMPPCAWDENERVMLF